MDYDSASSSDDRLPDLSDPRRPRKCHSSLKKPTRIYPPEFYSLSNDTASTSAPLPHSSSMDKNQRASVKIIERSLSSQVMEYYHKYSQSSNLDRYFSMPGSTFSTEAYKDYLKQQGAPKPWTSMRKSVLEPETSTSSNFPRERRRWARPPLIGQPSGAPPDVLTTNYETEITPEIEERSSTLQDSEIVSEERTDRRKDNLVLEGDVKAPSPTSSVASHKPLEWDSGADVGYHNALPRSKEKGKGMFSTIERMALARGLALRLDPEGTTGSTVDPAGSNNSPSRRQSKPDAHSTRLLNDVSESEGEIEITPIVKTNVPGIITGKVLGSEEITSKSTYSRKKGEEEKVEEKQEEQKCTECDNTPKSSQPGKYATERISRNFKDLQGLHNMKKSMSMNVLAFPLVSESLKRSQSELNIRDDGQQRSNRSRPLNFASTSSIATIIPKPLTCDKDTQANLTGESASRESIGIQVSAEEEGKVSLEEDHQKYEEECCSTNSLEARQLSEHQRPRQPYGTSSNHSKNSQEQQEPSRNPVPQQPKVSEEVVSEHHHENSEDQHQEKSRRLFQKSRQKCMEYSIEQYPEDEIPTTCEEKYSKKFALEAFSEKYPTKEYPETSRHQSSHKRYQKIAEVDHVPEDVPRNSCMKNRQTYKVKRSQMYSKELPEQPFEDVKTPQEEKPPLPKRITSLAQNPMSILKNSNNSSKRESEAQNSSSSESDGGRASNSFEYFPGHIYQNVPAGGETASHISSVDTRLSHSTMPNTSSSLDEKLWGDSDSLLRDLERSLNILKSLVDANKCDKHVKKRLIHHVIKRLVTAKYTDDKIEHDLEENVPWNPDNARNKVYRTEIIQALAKKQKQRVNSTESSEDWKPRKRSSSANRVSHSQKNDLKAMIRLVANSSENSDLFEGRHTDRTDGMPDGRKARMGLRTEDKLQGDIDTEKSSRSSECFVPQQMAFKQTSESKTPVKTSSSCSRRRGGDDKGDWRLPTTISERRFELQQCNYRDGHSSRLIDYVEMEKKNQLVWINNEINHLANLKKLLEEPKRYEKNGRQSSDLSEQALNDQWSSHGNLARANEPQTCSTRKRNSCTQTGSNGYSKSDGTEIISAMENLMRNNERRIANASVQTVTPTTSRDPSPSWSPRRGCLIHGNKRANCKCTRPTQVSSEAIQTTKKEAKNRINDACRSESNVDQTPRHCRGCRCGSKENSMNVEKMKQQTNNDLNSLERSGGRESRKAERVNELGEARRSECTCDEKEDERVVKSCRTCGTVYAGVNKKCQCIPTYVKPIAYELNFKDEKRRSPQGRRASSSTPASDGQSCRTEDCYCGPPQPKLKDYLQKNKPEFVDNVETRKRYMSEISQLRQLKKEKRMQFLAMASPSSLIISSQAPKKTSTKSQRKITDEEMKARLRLRYLRLNEVRNKRRKKEKEEQAKRNHLMAKIFCKKLQQKVLNGEVDLSQSVSVISNL